jgi:anti-anti-sigma factor
MVATKKDSENFKEVKLPNLLDIRSASAFFKDIKSVSKAGTNLVINAQNLEKITTPAIQVLLVSFVAVSKKNGSFKVINFSPEMEKVFVTVGLESQFNKWK